MLRTRGALLPWTASVVGRLPEGMVGLAAVLAVQAATGSFGWAGAAMAAFGVGGAVGGVVQARLVDRGRQTPVLVACGLAHAASLSLLAATARGARPLLPVVAAAAGASAPQLSACMRTLWGGLLARPAERQAAFALEAVVVEAVFLAGPVLAAGLVALAGPAATLLVAAGLSAAGTVGFAASAASRAWRGRGRDALAGPLASPAMRTLLLATFLFGVGDGALQLALPAWAVERGSPALGGLLLAAVSAGSVLGGLLHGTRSWPGRPSVRYAALHLLLGLGFAVVGVAGAAPALAGGPAVPVALLALAGLCIAPIATEGSLLVDDAIPSGVTEAFAWLVAAVIVGGAAGTAAAGPLVERLGFRPTMLAAAAAMAAAAVVAWLRRGSVAGDRPHRG